MYLTCPKLVLMVARSTFAALGRRAGGHESADVAQFPHAMASDGRRSAVRPLAPKKLGWQ